MRSQSIAFCLVLVFLGTAGCDLFQSEEKRAEIDLQAERKRCQVDQEVEFSAPNESQQTLFAQFCGPNLIYTIQRRNNSWGSYFGTICPAIYRIEFKAVAEPGEVFRFSRVVSDGGLYRAKLTYRFGSEGKKRTAHSGTFTVQK